jgi:muconolactone D-isomerase
MEFLVTTELNLPPGVDPVERDRLYAEERKRGFELKAEGSIVRIWRIPGAPWKTVSIREAADPEALQRDLETLPVFHWLKIDVIALARHPIDEG